MTTTIDPEFEARIPPLRDDEIVELERSMLRDGCLSPLIVWKGKGILLDGHHRKAICEKHGIAYETVVVDIADRDEALNWIDRHAVSRRNLTPDQRAVLIARDYDFRKHSHGGDRKSKCQHDTLIDDTATQVADEHHVSRRTVHRASRDLSLLREANAVDDVLAGKKRIADVRREHQQQQRQAKRLEAAAHIDAVHDQIIVGDFREHADKIPDGSLSLIFTDPPYDRKASALYDGLGAFAAAKLAEGGSLITYVGHVQLKEAMNALDEHLRFWWPICCMHSGKKATMREYGVRVHWKPMLWYVKGTRHDTRDMVADVISGGQEKSAHDWQQSIPEAAYWIEKLCPRDGIVCDPFMGGGTRRRSRRRRSSVSGSASRSIGIRRVLRRRDWRTNERSTPTVSARHRSTARG